VWLELISNMLEASFFIEAYDGVFVGSIVNGLIVYRKAGVTFEGTRFIANFSGKIFMILEL
jgi:hypothetical protein